MRHVERETCDYISPWFDCRSVVSISRCVTGKRRGKGERPLLLLQRCGSQGHNSHLLYVRNKMPASGSSGITRQCQPTWTLILLWHYLPYSHLQFRCICLSFFCPSNIFSGCILNLASPPCTQSCRSHFFQISLGFFFLSLGSSDAQPYNVVYTLTLSKQYTSAVSVLQHWLVVDGPECPQTHLFWVKMYVATLAGNCTEPAKTTMLYLNHKCSHMNELICNLRHMLIV